jgi:hypothetical protein
MEACPVDFDFHIDVPEEYLAVHGNRSFRTDVCVTELLSRMDFSMDGSISRSEFVTGWNGWVTPPCFEGSETSRTRVAALVTLLGLLG